MKARRSLYARPEIRSEDSSAPQVHSLVVEDCLDMAPAFVPQMTTQAPLPEICQKLRYAQPHAAPRSNPRQRLSPARLCGHVKWCVVR
jgi:hypothetical protein